MCPSFQGKDSTCSRGCACPGCVCVSCSKAQPGYPQPQKFLHKCPVQASPLGLPASLRTDCTDHVCIPWPKG